MHVVVLFVVLPLAFLLFTILAGFLAFLFVLPRARVSESRRLKQSGSTPREQPFHAAVVTASPASHSPRARNHVVALVKSGKYSATFHAYAPCPPFHAQDAADFIPIAHPVCGSSRPNLLCRVLTVARHLYFSLTMHHAVCRYDVIIVNNPPCIPSFLVVLLAASLVHGCPVVVDWHNFAYTIMQSTGTKPAIVWIARAYECLIGRLMHGHFCVSNAMSRHLAETWGIEAAVVYDRPPEHFGLINDVPTIHSLFHRVHECAGKDLLDDHGSTQVTVVEASGVDAVRLRPDRPAIVVSSTSWTPDEDFGILLECLATLDEEMQRRTPATADARVLCIITGKGPLRAEFERRVDRLVMKHVQVWFAWLQASDYHLLLGCADVGVSLHTSSSGLDLPMKAVDMLGCGLPVFSYDYDCIAELVQEGKTGFVFRNSQELTNLLKNKLLDTSGRAKLKAMSDRIGETFSSPRMRWQAGWERDALPLLSSLVAAARTSRR